MAPHVAAAWNLSYRGQKVEAGYVVEYVCVSQNRNPFRRVQPTLSDGARRIDLEKYVDMIRDAASSILNVFNFSRDVSIVHRKSKKKEI